MNWNINVIGEHAGIVWRALNAGEMSWDALHCAVLLFEPWWLRIGMIVMVVCVTAYILSFKTRRTSE